MYGLSTIKCYNVIASFGWTLQLRQLGDNDK